MVKRMDSPLLALAENAKIARRCGGQAATSGRYSMSNKIVVYSQPG